MAMPEEALPLPKQPMSPNQAFISPALGRISLRTGQPESAPRGLSVNGISAENREILTGVLDVIGDLRKKVFSLRDELINYPKQTEIGENSNPTVIPLD